MSKKIIGIFVFTLMVFATLLVDIAAPEKSIKYEKETYIKNSEKITKSLDQIEKNDLNDLVHLIPKDGHTDIRDDISIDLAGQWGGCSYAIAVQGNYAYMGIGPRVIILDISEPSNPLYIAQSPILPSTVIKIVVIDSYAYIADSYGGLQILDVSNPTDPLWTGGYLPTEVEAQFMDIVVVGDYAYISNYYYGLHIIDVSDPYSPQQVGSCFTVDYGNSAVDVSGNYAYIVQWYDVYIINVLDPFNPILVKIYDASLPNDIAVSGSLAYIGGSHILEIVNVANPANPIHISSYSLHGNYVNDVEVVGTKVYLAKAQTSFEIVDVSNPANPIFVGSYDTDTGGDVEIIQNKAFLIDWLYGLYVLDISTAVPQLLGTYSETAHGQRVSFVDGYVYMAGYRPGTHIIDVRTPENATRSTIDTTMYHGFRHLDTSDGYAFVASEGSGVKIFNVSDPASPVEVGWYDTNGYVTDVVVADYLAYVTDGVGGLVILNVSDPTTPQFIAQCPVGYARYCAYENHHVYVSDNSSTSLKIIDVSNPYQPYVIGSCPTTSVPETVTVSNNRVYVAVRYTGLDIIDVSDPANPVRLGNIDPDPYTWTKYVVQAGDYAYLIYEGYYVSVIDVSNSTAPALVMNYETSGYPVDIALKGSYLYVADDSGGLAILVVRIPGDTNGDGLVNFGDINPFVLALSQGYSGYHEHYPYVNWYNADINNDGLVDFGDINPFVALLTGR